MKKILLLLSFIALFSYTHGQIKKDFTANNGGLSWDNNTPVLNASVSVDRTSVTDRIYLYNAAGEKVVRLDSVGVWPNHTVNGEVTLSPLEFMNVLINNGFGGSSGEATTSPLAFPYYQLMDDVGDGSGNDNMAVDGSVTPDTFRVSPPSDLIVYMARIITSIRDGGSFDSGGWGNNGGQPLANGLELKWYRNGIVYNLTKSPIKSHYDLASYSYDITPHNWGQGDEFVTDRFTFTKAGQYLIIDGRLGDELWVIVNDDLEYLVDQRVSAQGYYEFVE